MGWGGGGLNDVLFRGQAFAAIIKPLEERNTQRTKRQQEEDVAAGTRTLPLLSQPTSGRRVQDD